MGVRCCGNIARSIETVSFSFFYPQNFSISHFTLQNKYSVKKKKGLGGHR